MSEKNESQKSGGTGKAPLILIIILLIIIIILLIGKDYFKASYDALQKPAAELAEELNEEQTEEQRKQQSEAENKAEPAEEQKDSNSSPSADLKTAADSLVEAAKAAALSHAGLNGEDVTFIKARADGKGEYDIEFTDGSTKYEYEIDTNSGNIKDFESEVTEQLSLYESAEGIITPDEAKTAALTALKLDEGEAVLTKIKLDFDDGNYEYEVEYFADNTLYSCEINASTGDVLEIERDNNRITD